MLKQSKSVLKVLLLLSMASSLSACGAFSATTLRCGTDGESSYVEVASAPQSIANNTRAYAELCGFSYEKAD